MKLIDGVPLYIGELVDEEDGVEFISFVDSPASKSTFLKFASEEIKLALDEEKRIVTGCALRADYPIYRKKGYWITFPPEQIEKIAYKFLRDNKISDVNIDHNSVDQPEGVYLIESFILTKDHQLSFEEFKELEEGSWIVSYKVENEEIWQAIKEGRLNGFSPELSVRLSEAEKNTIDLKEIYSEITDIELLINKLKK